MSSSNWFGFHILEEEEREERAATAAAMATARALATAQDLRSQLAQVDREIAEVKGQLDHDGGDDPSLWPLRRKLVVLHRKRDELVDQLGGGRRK
jgi:hypothetical protein